MRVVMQVTYQTLSEQGQSLEMQYAHSRAKKSLSPARKGKSRSPGQGHRISRTVKPSNKTPFSNVLIPVAIPPLLQVSKDRLQANATEAPAVNENALLVLLADNEA